MTSHHGLRLWTMWQDAEHFYKWLKWKCTGMMNRVKNNQTAGRPTHNLLASSLVSIPIRFSLSLGVPISYPTAENARRANILAKDHERASPGNPANPETKFPSPTLPEIPVRRIVKGAAFGRPNTETVQTRCPNHIRQTPFVHSFWVLEYKLGYISTFGSFNLRS